MFLGVFKSEMHIHLGYGWTWDIIINVSSATFPRLFWSLMKTFFFFFIKNVTCLTSHNKQ